MRTVDREPIKSRRVYYYVHEPQSIGCFFCCQEEPCNVIKVTARTWLEKSFVFCSSNGARFSQSETRNRLYRDKKKAIKRAAVLNKERAKRLQIKIEAIEDQIEILESNP